MMASLDHALGLELGCYSLDFLIKIFSKALDQGVFEKLPKRQPQGTAFLYGRLTDVPTVVVERYGTIAQALLTDGVKVA